MHMAYLCRAATIFSRWLCVVFISLFLTSAWADQASGLSWLQAQIKADGSLASEASSSALPVQIRSETATTQHKFLVPVKPVLTNAIDSVGGDTVEILARKSIEKRIVSPSLIYLDALVLQQNSNGGFGAAAGYVSNAQDTAFALAALTGSGNSYDSAVDRAITWLLAAQEASGQWSVAADGDALVPTSIVVQALHAYRQATVVASALYKARVWLLSARDAGGTWRAAVRNAHALLAVLPGLPNAASVQPAVDTLRAEQRADGSWEGDAYVTALALRALFTAEQPTTDPDMSSLQGRIVSEATGLPLPDVQVRLVGVGKTTRTDAHGRFNFPQLSSGTEGVVVEASGHLTLTSTIQLQKGQQLDLGTVFLKALSGSNVSTVTVVGVAKFTNDGITFQNAVNAAITVGGQTVNTNAAGAYLLENVAEGATELHATYSSFQQVTVNFSAIAGQQVTFNPIFRANSGQSTLKVVVSAEETGLPIASASVMLNGFFLTANAKGEVNFATGVMAGENSVAVTANGYTTRILTFTAQGYQSISLPVTLSAPATAPGPTSLHGIVTDAATRLPVAGVSVTIEGAGRTALSDYTGNYSISGAPNFSGVRKVVFDKVGYQRHEQTITLVQNASHQFDVPLQLQADTSRPISLAVTVTDRVTRQPVAGAMVTLSGSNPHILRTDAIGSATVTGLNAGATQVQVVAAGYDNVAFATDLLEGRDYQLPVEMTPQILGSDRVYGVVLDAQSRRPLAGARVTLAGTAVHESIAGADGRYEFTNINPGRWYLAAAASGYKGTGRGFDIAASTEIDLPLNADYGLSGDKVLRAVAVGHPNNSSSAIGYLFIFGAAGTVGEVKSNDGAINHSFTIDASGVAEVMVPNKQFLSPANAVLGKAMLIFADQPVSAYFLNRERYTTDMSYLLGVSAMGTEYRVLDWEYSYSTIQFSLTAIEDGTVATVTPRATLASGQLANVPFDVTLNKGQSVLYTASSGSEISGTAIRSNKVLAVFAGGQCANIPTNAGYCDHLFTQLPPVKYWASRYVVPVTANSGIAGNLVRILANTAATQIRVNEILVATLNSGEFHEIATAGNLYIESSSPVLVGQFLKGSTATTGGALGDPAFSFVAGIDQTLSDYVFTAPTSLSPYQENYLNVAVLTSDLPSLELNGAPVDTTAFKPVGTSGYSAGNVKIATGPGRIKAAQPFFATISGFSQDDSYHTIIGASYASGASQVPIVASIRAETDQPTYPSETAVQLLASISNQGSVVANLQAVLRIHDAQGIEIARFAPHSAGNVAPGATLQLEQAWNTARLPAGTYTVIAVLLDGTGGIVTTASTEFSITAGAGAQAPKVALTVTVEKAIYTANDRVRIDNLVSNLTVNAPIDNARVRLTVRDPHNVVVFTHTHAIGQLLASSIRSLDASQLLKDAPAGRYTVQAVLIGSGNQIKETAVLNGQAKAYDVDVEMASATTSFTVLAGGVGLPGGPGRVTGIPVNQPSFLWLAALILAGMAAMRLRKLPKQKQGGV